MEVVKSQNFKILKYAIVIFLGSILLAISSKIKIPFYPVPMTMQTFVVIFLGIAFGWKVGVATISLYIIEGIIGLPVFSGTPEKGIGLTYLMGPTGGYLFGFLVATYLAGSFKYDYVNIKKVKLNPKYPIIVRYLDGISSLIIEITKNLIKLLFAVSFIYIFGLLWLGFLIGWDKPIFQLGALPFLTAELFKMLILSITAAYIVKIKKII